MTANAKKQAQMIAPDAYPQMMKAGDVARAMATLRSAQTKVKAQVAMDAAVPPIRASVLTLIGQLDGAGQDMAQVFDLMHEIRGTAETGGLVTVGRIADVLCRYMDDLQRLGFGLDAHIVALHVAAITRAAHADEDDVRMGEIVATELAALVARRLVDAQGA